MNAIKRYSGKHIKDVKIILFLFVTFLAASTEAISSNKKILAEPVRLENAEPGDCAACHSTKKVLPNDHVITTKMKIAQCKLCHRKNADTEEGLASSIRGKMPLSHTHYLAGIKCTDCHGKNRTAEAITIEKCFSCHKSYETLITKTAKTKPNPHKGHYGETNCDLCHHQHYKSENFCAQCHFFQYVVP